MPPTTGQHSLAASHRAIHLTLSPKNSARKTTCSATHRSQHSRLRFQPPPRSPHLRFLFRVFRVFRGERWFPVENTVIEQAHALLARAKAHATVAGPRNPRSRHSAAFRVFPRPKKRHTHDSFSVCSVMSDGFRLKTPLLNNRTRNLRGLKPTLRLLDRAIRGHVIPRFSAFFSGQKNDTHTLAKQPVLPPPFTTFPPPLSASPEIATPTISFPCLPCLPW